MTKAEKQARTMRAALNLFSQRGEVGRTVSQADYELARKSVRDLYFTADSVAPMLAILRATEGEIGPTATRLIAECRLS